MPDFIIVNKDRYFNIFGIIQNIEILTWKAYVQFLILVEVQALSLLQNID